MSWLYLHVHIAAVVTVLFLRDDDANAVMPCSRVASIMLTVTSFDLNQNADAYYEDAGAAAADDLHLLVN